MTSDGPNHDRDRVDDRPIAEKGSRHDDAPQQEPVTIDPFDPSRFEQELQLDAVIRWGAGVLILAALVFAALFDQSGSVGGLALVMLLVFLWIWISAISTSVWRELPGVMMMVGPDPAAAEAALVPLFKRKPLMRWVRLMLYMTLASVRHRQQRFAESAAICQAVLTKPMGPAKRQRGRVLLMLAEARLQCADLHGAYQALYEAHGIRMSLAESLQRIALQTRYEVMAGHDRAALANTRQKLLLSELMPPVQCGAMHAMLTVSAKRTGQGDLADWLNRRSELLVGADQLQRLIQSAFAVSIVSPPEPVAGPKF